jgi:bacterioferritin-associated ferredoxin
MIVCVCRRVSDREIARHAQAGMGFDEIQFELGVATQCGRCEGCARDVVARCSADGTLARLQRSLRELGVLPFSQLPAGPMAA